jgi:hypothetical protein
MFLLIAIRLLVKVAGWVFYVQTARIDPDLCRMAIVKISYQVLETYTIYRDGM